MSRRNKNNTTYPSKSVADGVFSSQQEIVDLPSPVAGQIVIKIVLLLLFIFSFFTIFLGLWLVNEETTVISNMTENMWLFFLPLPIPLASLIMGIRYKRRGFKSTKNIVVGIIFSVLLVAYGSFTFLFRETFSHDYSYVNQISTEIHFDLPNMGEIVMQDFTDGTQTATQADTVQYYYVSDIVFTDEQEISTFNKALSESELWIRSVRTTLMGFVPSMYSYQLFSTQYQYYMLYNVDLKSYNCAPESSGTYRYLFIAYNSMDGTMMIIEYALVVLA